MADYVQRGNASSRSEGNLYIVDPTYKWNGYTRGPVWPDGMYPVNDHYRLVPPSKPPRYDTKGVHTNRWSAPDYEDGLWGGGDTNNGVLYEVAVPDIRYHTPQVFPQNNIGHKNQSELHETEVKKQKPNKCNKCFPWCKRKWLTKHNPLAKDASCCDKCNFGFLCPPHGILANFFTGIISIILLWAVCWAILGAEALPGGNIFSLVILLVCCSIAGRLVELIHLPPLLGMLIMGFILRNVPVIDVAKDIRGDWSATLRTVALAVILVRAGLGLHYDKLKALSGAVIRLSVFPCTFEVVAVAGMAVVLFQFTWDWAFMIGFVHAAVSPAVVVPSMLTLQEKGLGVDKGVPTMLIAAASLENVLAIGGFYLVLGVTFSEGSLLFNILRCPMEIVIGIAFGGLAGIVLWYIPHPKQDKVEMVRFLLLLGTGLFSTFGAKAATIPGAGALGCLIVAFVAGHGWKKKRSNHGTEDEVTGMVGTLWLALFQPLLFGLIGAEVQIADIDKDVIGSATAMAVVGLLFRSTASFLSAFGTSLQRKEQLFVTLAWLPKATVQAAIGSVALDTVYEKKILDDDYEDDEPRERARIILTVAVYVILLTAPLGAVLISLLAPRLLVSNTLTTVEPSTPSQGSTSGDKDSRTTDTELTISTRMTYI